MSNCRAAHREQLADGIYKLTIYTDECRFTRPGQYALITAGEITKPYQICDYDSERFTIVYRDDDQAGRELANTEYGAGLEAVTGLGNGFDTDIIPDGAVLAADTYGITDMLELARCLLIRGVKFKIILGYPDRSHMYMVDSFRRLCSELEVLTADGSNGRAGSPQDIIRSADYICASGSPEMLRILAEKAGDGQFSFSGVIGRADGDIIKTAALESCGGSWPVLKKCELIQSL